MHILVLYDIETTTRYGSKRLNKAAKICLQYGTRVQNSVYECCIDQMQLLKMKTDLLNIINLDTDSLRIYNLGKTNQCEHYGIKPGLKADGLLIF